MADNKTKPVTASVENFLNKITDTKKKEDCIHISKLMEQITRQKPVMWGSSIIGFGSYHYKYASGREGDAPIAAFSPRAQNITIYAMSCIETYPALTAKLGKFKTGKGCLYIARLDDIDLKILKELIIKSFEHSKKLHSS